MRHVSTAHGHGRYMEYLTALIVKVMALKVKVGALHGITVWCYVCYVCYGLLVPAVRTVSQGKGYAISLRCAEDILDPGRAGYPISCRAHGRRLHIPCHSRALLCAQGPARGEMSTRSTCGLKVVLRYCCKKL